MTWLALFSQSKEKGLHLARTIITERQKGNVEPGKQEIEARLKRTKLPAPSTVLDHTPPTAALAAPAITTSAHAMPPSSISDAIVWRPEGGEVTAAPAEPAPTLTAVNVVASAPPVAGDVALPTPPAGQIASARGVPLPPASRPKQGSTSKRPTAQARQAAGPLRPLVAPDMEPSTFAALAIAYAQELLAQAAGITPDALPTVTINQAELSLAVSLLRQSNLFRNQLNQSWQREATTTTEADEGSLEPEPSDTSDEDEPE